jgi:tRNA threonylcarbamoyl adenosine modification protein YjeE
MTAALPDTGVRCLAASAEKPLLELSLERDAVALGPGLGRHPETEALVRSIAGALERPLVIDADGLNALAGAASALKGRRAATIVTPHPGEAARLLASTSDAINRDRVAAARRLAQETGAVVLLKGAASIVADPDGRVLVNPTGGPALATGGTGDVLTGIAVALLAQAVPPFEAAGLAAYLHGFAADRIAARTGPSGLQAADLADEVPVAARALRESAGETRALGAVLDRGAVLSLCGPLGAGKTEFAQGLAEGLGLDPRQVASPTFAIIHVYESGAGGRRMAHVDLFRIDSVDELFEAGFLDLLAHENVVAIEWGDRLPQVLPEPRLEVRIERHTAGGVESAREIEVVARGTAAEATLLRWQAALAVAERLDHSSAA